MSAAPDMTVFRELACRCFAKKPEPYPGLGCGQQAQDDLAAWALLADLDSRGIPMDPRRPGTMPLHEIVARGWLAAHGEQP